MPPKPTQQAERIVSRLLQHQGDQPLNVKVDRSILQFTELDQPLWPEIRHEDGSIKQPAILKRHLLAYYAAMSPIILPHLQDRPLILRQFPQGITSQSNILRHAEGPLPEYVQTVEMFSDLAGHNMPFFLCQNTATLLWLVNADVIELYPWYSRINPDGTTLPTIFINSGGNLEMSVANYPDYLVFDIDSVALLAHQQSANPLDQFKRNKEAALYIHQYLAKLQLSSFVKTSGKNGLHVIVPLQRNYSFEYVRQWAQKAGQQLTDRYPQLFSMGWQLDHGARVSLDFHQNARNKAFAAPYTLRATSQATISHPLSWRDLEALREPEEFSLFNHLPLEEQGSLNGLPNHTEGAWRLSSLTPQELPPL